MDAALAEARKALFTGGFAGEWGTPVLYMRAADSNLWRKAEQTGSKNRLRLLAAIGMAVILLAALAAAAYAFVGPTRMDPKSTMNIAVTDVGLMDDGGQMRPSPDGQLIRGWVAGALESANRQADATGRVALWHDGLPRVQKRVKLGMVAGKTPDDRARRLKHSRSGSAPTW